MNNFIEYFYNIKIDKITYHNKYYSFIYNGYIYKLYFIDEIINTDSLLDINRKLINNTLISEIIINRNNEVISIYNNYKYILIKIYVSIGKSITLSEISNLSNTLYKENLNINWGMLWERKIDYLENLINENGKKYPLIVNSFNYFVGMAENAISYYNNIKIDNNYKYTINHKNIRIDSTVEDFYNPLNIIYDYKVRDVAEYIKNSFFNKNDKIYDEINLYLKYNHLSLMEIKLLISRILYPSFYFNMYEDIMIDEKEEIIIVDIINNLDEYENYLADIIDFFNKYYEIEDIMWLKKGKYYN